MSTKSPSVSSTLSRFIVAWAFLIKVPRIDCLLGPLRRYGGLNLGAVKLLALGDRSMLAYVDQVPKRNARVGLRRMLGRGACTEIQRAMLVDAS